MQVRRVFSCSILCLSLVSVVAAQKAADPTGHWTGTIHAPEMVVPFEADFQRDAKGELVGTIDLPAEKIHGLPMQRIVVDGAAIAFHVRSDQPLTGTLSADGATITGDMTAAGGTAPFTMTRTGDPRMETAAPQPPIAAALEGTWSATIESGMGGMRIELSLANVDNAATARLVNLDQGSLTIPASRIVQNGTALTLEFKSIGATYSGTVNADATAVAGTFTQTRGSVPVTFSRKK
jgi:hypothetical protein